MKLLKLHMKSGGSSGGILDGFSINFNSKEERSLRKISPICFVGINGSGKSQVLQVIAEIFYYLDRHFCKFHPSRIRTNLFFEIEYLIKDGKKMRHVLIERTAPKGNLKVFIVNNEEKVPIIDSGEIEKLLPHKIIGYSSGGNETLSIPFLNTYQEYADYVAKLALKGDVGYQNVPDTRLVLMDYNSNIAILIANFLFRDSKQLAIFSNTIKLQRLHSFRIIVQLSHKAAPQKGVKLTDELNSYVEKLKKCSTCHNLDVTTKTWIFDFFVNEETKNAFQYHFSSAFELYSAFYKLELLNNLIIEKKHLTKIHKLRKEKGMVVKAPTVPEEDKVFRFQGVRLKHKDSNVPVDYISLSDGEHQFIHIFGTVMMVDQENILFLLDEPESHFNPKWRIELITNLTKTVSSCHQQFLLSSHSPYIISDCPKEKVFIFEKQRNKVLVRNPEKETYGAAFDELLKDAFNINPPISKKSLQDVRKLQKSDDLEKLKIHAPKFGSSIEKFYLNQRIAELKSQKDK